MLSIWSLLVRYIRRIGTNIGLLVGWRWSSVNCLVATECLSSAMQDAVREELSESFCSIAAQATAPTPVATVVNASDPLDPADLGEDEVIGEARVLSDIWSEPAARRAIGCRIRETIGENRLDHRINPCRSKPAGSPLSGCALDRRKRSTHGAAQTATRGRYSHRSRTGCRDAIILSALPSLNSSIDPRSLSRF
jgi:hypothetical protein